MSFSIRRICLIAGPGAGKSTLACYIKAELSFLGFNVEMVEEPIKDKAFQMLKPSDSEQLLLNSKQINKEHIRLKSGVDIVISDGPAILNYFYAEKSGCYFKDSILHASLLFDDLYTPMYIFINREEKLFNPKGRFETFQESLDIDNSIRTMLNNLGITFKEFRCKEKNSIIDYIVSKYKF